MMKNLLCLYCILFLFMGLAGCGEPDSPIEAATTTANTLPLYWRGWPYGQVCAQRDLAIDTYSVREIDGSEMIRSTEGSDITGYYDENNQLQIMEIAVYGEIGRWIDRFYPMQDAVAIKSESIWYTTAPFSEVTEDDQYHDGTARMSIEDGQLYYYIDTREPMYASDDTWYAEIYAKAVEALSEARAGE